MSILLLGLFLFLLPHSVRIVADSWRSRQLARIGEKRWKAAYSLLSLAGLLLVVWGYGQARLMAPQLWPALDAARPLTALLMWLALVLLVASRLPGSRLRARVGHPMVLGVALWALAHLLVNSSLADVVLFGSFLLWALLDFASAHARDRQQAGFARHGELRRDLLVLLLGSALWLLFAAVLHPLLFGVAVR